MSEFCVLKENKMFMICDSAGNIKEAKDTKHGIYYNDTRMVSYYELGFGEFEMKMLDASYAKNYQHVQFYTNNSYESENGIEVPQNAIDIKKERCINDAFIEKVTITNNNKLPVQLTLYLDIKLDFEDIFEIRGDVEKPKRNVVHNKVKNGYEFHYKGLDGKTQTTYVVFNGLPFVEVNGRYFFEISLEPKASEQVQIAVGPEQIQNVKFDCQIEKLQSKYKEWKEENTVIQTDNEAVNSILEQSIGDLRLLLMENDGNKFYAAGIPWFVTLFGRDSILASLYSLAFNPDIAKSTLRLLSYYQGKEVNVKREEQPGKIIHELRLSELPNIGIVPFGEYYGSIDSTLLYLILAESHFNWTGDVEFIKEIEYSLRVAIKWIDTYGDMDKDGYLEYVRSTESGLINQGWKDSRDCLVFKDGIAAQAPIALCEVQGYIYHAKKHISRIFKVLGDEELSEKLYNQAEKLKEKFNKEFWMEEESFFALALDKDKRQIDSTTSNVGQCLFSGIINEEKIDLVTEKLMSEEMFSGWGIRTLSTDNAAYNPISYHNGSVWPHDTSLIAFGLGAVEKSEECLKIAQGIFEAAKHFNNRLPELFCGFSKKERDIPVSYPVSCKPQAWAAASPLLLMQSVLGIYPDAYNNRVCIKPRLNNDITIKKVTVKNLRVGDSIIDIKIDGSDFEVLNVQGTIKIVDYR
ncbi:MAG: amylo-alpha-1,6-glucosidase [Halanaerobiales bacterium]|nr:amylo-alpha-1,6-glucosidase [Halanaerobiales bacterium]